MSRVPVLSYFPFATVALVRLVTQHKKMRCCVGNIPVEVKISVHIISSERSTTNPRGTLIGGKSSYYVLKWPKINFFFLLLPPLGSYFFFNTVSWKLSSCVSELQLRLCFSWRTSSYNHYVVMYFLKEWSYLYQQKVTRNKVLGVNGGCRTDKPQAWVWVPESGWD